MVEITQPNSSAKADEVIQHSETELMILAGFFVESCNQLLGVSKELINKELLPEGSFDILRKFASDKNQRTLVFSKIEPSAATDEELKQGQAEKKEPQESQAGSIVLTISDKVTYHGSSAQAIAFLKREPYKRLTLKDQQLKKQESTEASTPTPLPEENNMEEVVDLSSQLQVINLGYIGQESNIFELASTYVDFSILPLFQDYKTKSQGVSAQGTENQGSAAGLDNILKGLSSLKMNLAQCRQNQDIPNVELAIEPTIKARIEAARERKEVCKIGAFDDLASDKHFLAKLDNYVGTWYRDIRKITGLDHPIENGNTLQEINFWSQMEQRLNYVKERQISEEVQMTLNILQQAKKYMTVMTFQHDTDIDPKIKTARDYNKLLREIPIQSLYDALTLEQIITAIKAIFAILKKMRYLASTYPLDRTLDLSECIARDFDAQLKKVIASRQIMQIEYSEHKAMTTDIFKLQEVWKECIEELKQSIAAKIQQSTSTTKRNEYDERLNNMADDPVCKRLSLIITFRNDHDKLEQVITSTFSRQDQSSEKSRQANKNQSLIDIKESYDVFCKSVNVLDISKEGQLAWDNAKKAYDLATSKIEQQLTQLLKNKLAKAATASDMLQVFSDFNKLLMRPKIRATITQYQSQLLNQVHKDIDKLKNKLFQQDKMDKTLNKARDLPDIVNKIVWMNNLNKKLKFYQDKVSTILGANWESQQEGIELKKTCDQVYKRLSQTQNELFQNWLKRIMALEPLNEKEKSIFQIQPKGNKYQLVLNFNEELFRLHKEKLNLDRAITRFDLPFKMSIHAKIKSDAFEKLYPIAMSLQQSLRTFQVTNSKIGEEFEMLINEKKNEAQQQLLLGLEQNWKNETVAKNFAQKLLPKVIAFEEAVNDVAQKTEYINQLLHEMTECELAKDNFEQRLTKIQTVIDDFDLEDLSNLSFWVQGLNDKIEKILVKRLEQLLTNWIDEFVHFDTKAGKLIQSKMVLDIKIQDLAIVMEPTLSEARAYWYKELHKQVEVICGLEKVESKKVLDDERKEHTYTNLLTQMGEKCNIKVVYSKLEEIFCDAEAYYETWKSYQALWDIENSSIYDLLGDNIDRWNQLLNEIRQGRKTFDTSDDFKYFGGLEISYGTVQGKVNNKYDQIHKEILNKFGATLAEQMKAFKDKVQNGRRQLESLSLEECDDVTLFVTEIQEMKRVVTQWESQLDRCKAGQKLLSQQRFIYPHDWLWIDVIEGEWASFRQILNRRSATMDEQIPSLQAKILQEETQVDKKIKEIEIEWRDQRPKEASDNPQEASPAIKKAINWMVILGQKIKTTIQELVRVCKAKELLEMELGDPHYLDNLSEDHTNLLQVWQKVQEIWAVIDQIEQTPFQVYINKTVKDALEALQNQMREFPTRMRSYQIYDVYNNHLKNYKKFNEILLDLRNDAMKPKHWKDLLSKLHIGTKFQDITLGDLWNADLLGKSKIVNDVLTQSRGEAILENFINMIKETWNTQEVELVNYQSKCKLIKGWDDLFQLCEDHMNNINSMKMSPYYKVFEKEIEPWSKTLEQIRITFDYWIDVQRRYVYLEGIFFGSADIKSMLSNEFTRFKNIDTDFTKLMKQVTKTPVVLEVMKIPNLEKMLQTFTNSLQLIQKALGEYLEKQRSNFARFYFVGDEDLLEIIGNSKMIKNVQRHFPKMFAGITTLNYENEGDSLIGMNSREGESVPFAKAVVISEDPTIYKWLTKVEEAMQVALAVLLEKSVKELEILDRTTQHEEFNQWIVNFPAQIDILALQVSWSNRVEDAFVAKGKHLVYVEESIKVTLEMLAERVLTDLPSDIRKKYEQLITDLVHQRIVSEQMINEKITDKNQFPWLYHMRFYFNSRVQNPLEKLGIKMANSDFFYGFEYLGVGEKLVQTQLTDRCYLTLTQALHWRMGGSPFGPAGTGKTESVKALGAQLGRFVLVFNCDETFDGNAMGRIFVGLCQVGAWGCFDEFNRLEERMLSAVSQQILTIQTGLREQAKKMELMGREIRLNQQMGIFITMNPDYAGRSQLPDNLKQLFRAMAMTQPNKDMIARVMLYSQGFKTAGPLSGKIVSLFGLCHSQLSSQSHYDFGLRALKSVLVSAGNLKRKEKALLADASLIDENWEAKILIKSLCDTLVPKLIAEDIPLLSSLLTGVFPGSSIIQQREGELKNQLMQVVNKYNLVASEQFIEKCMQLFQIQNLCHGVMMVGPTGVGKSAAWKLLLDCMERVDKVQGVSYIVDPKAISKDDLYGKLDSTTAEWTDGVFTGILRRIIDNARGEANKRHWIIFDGDVDPEWAENLNSVLDDNKLLTLPSGERLQIPPNVRIMFEVETLKYATLATVSRCGMVWFSNETVSSSMMYHHYLCRLQQDVYDSIGEDGQPQNQEGKSEENTMRQLSEETVRNRTIRKQCVNAIRPLFEGEDDDCFATRSLELASTLTHVMEFTRMRCLEALFALIRKGIDNIIEYNENHQDFPLEVGQIENFMKKWTIFSTVWGIGGSMNLSTRTDYSNQICNFTSVETPPRGGSISFIDYEIRLDDQKWHLWKESVPVIDIDPKRVTDADVVITTVDTNRHQEVLCSWLSEKRPFLLCGPPGSGKTMTLMATLKKLTDMEMIFINFSSSTTPELILKTFDHYCDVKKTNSGLLMTPRQAGKWLVIFCDEINLPETDKYGTIPVITFLRQVTEQNGYYRQSDKQWVSLERIMFVGACNPPTDAGRSLLSDRFLRHAPLIFVDFPGPESLKQIYGTFNRAMLKRVPALRNCADPLTEAMVEFYSRSQQHFTADMQAHYIYSPRELTRWKYAINEALDPCEEPEDLVRLYVHEGLRLFEDRLVYAHEKVWCNETIDEVAKRWFPQIDANKALQRPIYFTNYLNKSYVSVGADELKDYIEARLKQFYEEELNVPLVVFDSVLDHILRIDRVLRQPLGHLLLVGASGVGKTTLTRFVSWMQDLALFQIKAGRNYSVFDFDEDLRKVMRQAGVDKRKTCFVFDESNVLGAAFLERMNALLAGGEVPGLFDGEEYTKLIAQCKEEGRKSNKMLDSEEEVYRQFTKDVQRNLHVVFTMNPSNPDFSNRTASSPALFNRCVIDWFGDWTDDGLLQVAQEFTKYLDVPNNSFTKSVEVAKNELQDGDNKKRIDPKTELLSRCIVEIHTSVRDLNIKLMKSAKKFNYITPRDFLDFIGHFVDLNQEKKSELEELQGHLNIGITKLKNTERSVSELGEKLKEYSKNLEKKQTEVNQKMASLTKESTKVSESQKVAEKTREALEKQTIEIAQRRESAERDLMRAEPALIAAQESVKGVTKGNIDEIKNYKIPPDKVKIAMEPVIALLKNQPKKPDWKDVQAEVKKDTFKTSVLEFDKDGISAKCKEFIQKDYLQNPAFDVDAINKASKAAGPLATWVKSIVEYADIFLKIEPLRNEVKELEAKKQVNEIEYEKILKEVKTLQANLDAMQAEYQQLVIELTQLKEEQLTVSKKVEKSSRLFVNLKSELDRWVESSKNFDDRMSSLVGDVLVSSAVLTYIGFFDHYQRKNLVADWRISVSQINMKTSLALSITEFLSKPQERIMWQHQELPNDDLCIENAIIMKRYNRYPLIIDPSDQALKYIMNHYAKQKIQKTSFTDTEFISRISEGLQYGVPILVQDVEKIDPVMNSVLNKEVHKVGGRLVMQLGDKEIACNGTLTMFMLTRNQNALFTPDLCSRVTFVNFTVTPSSLMSQCLNIYLKNERPDIDKRRSDLLKLQGESKEKLRMSEDQLLDALNNAKGEILDNDELIQTLESLKAEAKHIAEEVAKTDETLEEIEQVSNEYASIATMTTRVFFTLDSLSQIHYLYQYSLQHFMDIIFSVLKTNAVLQGVPMTDPQKRLRIITQQLFLQFNQTVNQGLLLEHQMLFSMRLAQIRLNEDDQSGALFDQFLKSAMVLEPKKLGDWLLEGRLTKTQLCGIEELSLTPHFNNLVDSMTNSDAQWIQFLEHPMAENFVPEPWFGGSDVSMRNPSARILKKLLIIKVLRPDRLIYSVTQFVQSVLGEEIATQGQIDLLTFVNVNVNAKSPLLMVSAPGYDASYKIELLAKQANKKYTSVAIGSPEAFGLVDQAIKNASKSGNWVLLKNVHLAPQWLTELEKKIYSMQLDQNFRLFLTMENNPKVPATLIRASHVMIFEPPSGIKAALVRSYTNTITQQRTDKEPIERKRLHFIVSWFNAVVQERLRYTPIGWSKVYEFNESDQRCTLDCVDEWIDSMGSNRTNIDPEKIPWDALKTLISQSVFGGKIDNDFDQKILISLVDKFFTHEIYESGFRLFEPPVGTDEESLVVPDAKSHKDYLSFIKQISLTETPAWSGLPNNVEKIVRERAANSLVANIKLIQGTGDDLDSGSGDSKDESKSQWLIQLQGKCEAMLNLCPGQLDRLKRTEKLIKNPLFRFLDREVTVASNLLDTVRRDLSMLIEMCQGERKSTQQLKSLAEELHADVIPNKWRKYVVPNISATIWLNDFVKRVEQLKKLSGQSDFGQSGLWFGGLLYPEAYLTATRQAVAQNNNWSLEELELQFEINLTEKQIETNSQGFILTGFTMQGAEYSTDQEMFKLTEKLQANLPNVNFKWVHKKQREEELAAQGITEEQLQQIAIPVYLNTMRRVLITPVKISTHGIPNYVWYQRGVALFAWSQA